MFINTYRCSQCKQDKPKSAFSIRKDKNSAKGIYSYCKDCGNQNTKNRLESNPELKKKKIIKSNNLRSLKRKVLRELVDGYKQSIGCFRCKYSEFGTSLQFHHLDPNSKEGRVSVMIAALKPLTEIQHEIDKCVILCGNCHAGLHAHLIPESELNEMALHKLPPLPMTDWSSVLNVLASSP